MKAYTRFTKELVEVTPPIHFWDNARGDVSLTNFLLIVSDEASMFVGVPADFEGNPVGNVINTFDVSRDGLLRKIEEIEES